MPPSEEARLDGRQNSARAQTTTIFFLIVANHGRCCRSIIVQATRIVALILAYHFPSAP